MSAERHSLSGTTLRQRTAEAATDERLRGNVARAVDRFTEHRLAGLAELGEPDELRHAARGVRNQVHAVGAQAGYVNPKTGVVLDGKYFYEYHAEASFKGHGFTISLGFKF